jgi:hypothetical protein
VRLGQGRSNQKGRGHGASSSSYRALSADFPIAR